MEEIKRGAMRRIALLPRLPRTRLTENICALVVLCGGGYTALRLMDLLFRALGVG